MTERTFSTLEPKGEVAVAPRPEGLKLILYTGSGEKVAIILISKTCSLKTK
jgi:hypothetical protein